MDKNERRTYIKEAHIVSWLNVEKLSINPKLICKSNAITIKVPTRALLRSSVAGMNEPVFASLPSKVHNWCYGLPLVLYIHSTGFWHTYPPLQYLTEYFHCPKNHLCSTLSCLLPHQPQGEVRIYFHWWDQNKKCWNQKCVLIDRG